MAAKSTHHETPEGWEKVNPTVNRMLVPGGWLYEMYGQGVVFVPYPVNGASEAGEDIVDGAGVLDQQIDSLGGK